VFAWRSLHGPSGRTATCSIASVLTPTELQSTSWGNDTLGAATLTNGVGTKIVFNTDIPSTCDFDFKLVYSDGTSQTYGRGRDLCEIIAIVYNEDESTALRTW
jgi:hypothetical protein